MRVAVALLVLSTGVAHAQTQPPRVRRAITAPTPAGVTRPVTVTLSLDLDDVGRVRAARVLHSGGAACDEAALAAVREMLFDPAREGARAVPTSIEYRYVFAGRSETPADEDAPPPTALAPNAGETVVRARVASREVQRRELVAEDLRRMAGTRGDALLAVQNLPGVGRPAFGQGAFIVRGSDPDDTLVTLESHPIVLPFHLYGLATTVATDLVERIEFLPGNFSSRWGRAAGGVVNVTLRAPPRDRAHVWTDLDVIDAGAALAVPLGRRVSLMAGARRSYLDGVLALFAPDAAGQSFSNLPRYWDWQLSLDADLGAHDQLRVLGAGSDDSIGLRVASPSPEYQSDTVTFGSRTAYHGVQARWRHRFSSRAEHTLSAALASTASEVALGPDVRYAVDTVTASLRDELDLRLSPHARLYAGLDVQLGSSSAAVVAPPLATNGVEDVPTRARLVRYADTRNFINPAAYAELALDPTRAFHLLAGVRVDGFSRSGGRWSIDPRLSMRVMAHARVALRAALGSYTTTPRGYTVLPGFGNPDLGLERWMHATVGASAWIVEGVLEFTLDAFAKRAGGVAAPSDRVLERDGVRTPERFASTGSARTMGLEAMVRLRAGRWPVLAWLSYTLQRAERRDTPEGRWYTSPWDQTHLLTCVLGVVLPRGWELGLRARYATGSPEARVVGGVYDSDHDVTLTLVDAANPGRLPSFVSLDVRASKRFRWGPVELQVIAEVLNATNAANVESRVYSFDRRTSVPVLGLPIIPNLGLRAEY
jgi:TonB family protein